MINAEKKELATKLGVENILVKYYAELGYKTSLTVILNKDLLLHYVGKTYSFIPITANGLDKKLSGKNVNELLDKVINGLSQELDAERNKQAKNDELKDKKNKNRDVR